MKVAIPICRNRISPVLDAAARLLVLTERRGQEVDRREFTLEPQPPEALASSIADLSVDVLLCAAISEPLLRELEMRGIWVRSHLCGEVEEILQAFCRGRLAWNQYVMPGCCHHQAHPFPSFVPATRCHFHLHNPFMKIAIPVENGRLHGHFGGCHQFALVEVDPQTRTSLRTELVAAPPHQPGLFPRWLAEQDVTWVIADGIGQRAMDRFAQQGITVRAGTPNATLEELVTDFLNGRLSQPPSGCTHHEHGHDPSPHSSHTHPSQVSCT